MHNSTWKHDRKLAAVSFKDRHDLPGHKPGRIKAHYPEVELQNLIETISRVCVQ